MVSWKFSPERKAAMRKQIFMLQFSIPVMIVSGIVLYRRWFGTEEEQQRLEKHRAAIEERRKHNPQ